MQTDFKFYSKDFSMHDETKKFAPTKFPDPGLIYSITHACMHACMNACHYICMTGQCIYSPPACMANVFVNDHS